MSRTMSFQLMSDLHLEFRSQCITVVPVADHLILAGDIGYPFAPLYKTFLTYVSGLFRTVFVVSGNHCYYNEHGIEATNVQISSICSSLPNVIFLNNQSYLLNGEILIAGTTLWTHVPSEKTLSVSNGISDYDEILHFDINVNNKLHQEAVEFLDTSSSSHYTSFTKL